MKRANIRNRGRPSKKKNHFWLSIIVFGLFVSSISTVMVSSYFVVNTFTHPDRTIAKYHPSKVGLQSENVLFESRDTSITLSGWMIKTKKTTNKWVILSHGYGGNRNIFGRRGPDFYKFLHDNGYNVLTFDYRNSGVSDGDITTVGFYEKEDLLGAIDFILTKDEKAEICLMGWSQGAATSLLAAGEHNAVKLVVSDSSFRNLKGYVNENLSQWTNLPNYPFTPAILSLIPVVTGMHLEDVSPMDEIAKINRPILLIHSQHDKTIPAKNSKYMYEKNKEEKEITLILYDTDQHKNAFKDFPEQYKRDILSFFYRYDF